MAHRLPCHILFGDARGEQIRAAVEEDTGCPCPCSQGSRCPLLGELQPATDPEHRLTQGLAATGPISEAHGHRRVS